MEKETLILKIKENESVVDFYGLKAEILKHLEGEAPKPAPKASKKKKTEGDMNG